MTQGQSGGWYYFPQGVALRHDVHVYVHGDVGVEKRLDEITRLLHAVLTKETKLAGELDALAAQVTQNTDLEGSAIQLLQGIKAALDAAIATQDPARLTALSQQLGTSAQALAAAITANTPPPAP